MAEARRGPDLLSVIIPVYNEHSTVGEVIDAIGALNLPLAHEVIVVDDGSDDGTGEMLRQRSGSIRIFTNNVNKGKGSAVRVGLEHARGSILLLQDADLETDPNEYEMLLRPILDGKASAVYGSRFLRKGNRVPFVRRAANSLLTTLTNILYGTSLTDMETAFKVFTSELAGKMELTAERFEIEPEITAEICRLGFEIVEVPVTYRPRTRLEGKKIRFRDGIRAVITLVTCRMRR